MYTIGSEITTGSGAEPSKRRRRTGRLTIKEEDQGSLLQMDPLKLEDVQPLGASAGLRRRLLKLLTATAFETFLETGPSPI